MTNSNCSPNIGCSWFAVLVGIILGIITGFLRFSAVITITPVFFWVTFGIAVATLFILFLTTQFTRLPSKDCTCLTVTTLLVGVLGTILSSLILLAFAFVATSIIGAIITGFLVFFFTLNIAALACLTTCSTDCNE